MSCSSVSRVLDSEIGSTGLTERALNADKTINKPVTKGGIGNSGLARELQRLKKRRNSI